MIRRSSGLSDEDESDEAPHSGAKSQDEDRRKDSFTSAKFDQKRHSVTLDRRKIDKSSSASPLTQNAPLDQARLHGVDEKQKMSNAVTESTSTPKMPDPGQQLRSRARSPWRISLLALTTTSLSMLFIFWIVHSFLTRQLDVKGCNNCGMRPMYEKMHGFDTEHTRFASKYSLYMYREAYIDEDSFVRTAYI